MSDINERLLKMSEDDAEIHLGLIMAKFGIGWIFRYLSKICGEEAQEYRDEPNPSNYHGYHEGYQTAREKMFMAFAEIYTAKAEVGNLIDMDNYQPKG